MNKVAHLVLSSESLDAVLLLLSLLPGSRSLLLEAVAPQPVEGLKLLRRVDGVVNQSKAGRLAATELRLESEEVDLVRVANVVHLRHLLLQRLLRDVREARVEHIEDLCEKGGTRDRSENTCQYHDRSGGIDSHPSGAADGRRRREQAPLRPGTASRPRAGRPREGAPHRPRNAPRRSDNNVFRVCVTRTN